jgi:hypothetical protein
VIAVALLVIAAVILLTVGVVTAATTPDYLNFFGASIRTTSAQIFLIGAICTWILLVACWLLMAGVRRSHERGAELAAAKRQAMADRVAGSTGQPPSRDRIYWTDRRYRIDRNADTLVLSTLAKRTGSRDRPDRQPPAEERAQARPAEE